MHYKGIKSAEITMKILSRSAFSNQTAKWFLNGCVGQHNISQHFFFTYSTNGQLNINCNDNVEIKDWTTFKSDFLKLTGNIKRQ